MTSAGAAAHTSNYTSANKSFGAVFCTGYAAVAAREQNGIVLFTLPDWKRKWTVGPPHTSYGVIRFAVFDPREELLFGVHNCGCFVVNITSGKIICDTLGSFYCTLDAAFPSPNRVLMILHWTHMAAQTVQITEYTMPERSTWTIGKLRAVGNVPSHAPHGVLSAIISTDGRRAAIHTIEAIHIWSIDTLEHLLSAEIADTQPLTFPAELVCPIYVLDRQIHVGALVLAVPARAIVQGVWLCRGRLCVWTLDSRDSQYQHSMSYYVHGPSTVVIWNLATMTRVMRVKLATGNVHGFSGNTLVAERICLAPSGMRPAGTGRAPAGGGTHRRLQQWPVGIDDRFALLAAIGRRRNRSLPPELLFKLYGRVCWEPSAKYVAWL